MDSSNKKEENNLLLQNKDLILSLYNKEGITFESIRKDLIQDGNQTSRRDEFKLTKTLLHRIKGGRGEEYFHFLCITITYFCITDNKVALSNLVSILEQDEDDGSTWERIADSVVERNLLTRQQLTDALTIPSSPPPTASLNPNELPPSTTTKEPAALSTNHVVRQLSFNATSFNATAFKTTGLSPAPSSSFKTPNVPTMAHTPGLTVRNGNTNTEYCGLDEKAALKMNRDNLTTARKMNRDNLTSARKTNRDGLESQNKQHDRSCQKDEYIEKQATIRNINNNQTKQLELVDGWIKSGLDPNTAMGLVEKIMAAPSNLTGTRTTTTAGTTTMNSAYATGNSPDSIFSNDSTASSSTTTTTKKFSNADKNPDNPALESTTNMMDTDTTSITTTSKFDQDDMDIMASTLTRTTNMDDAAENSPVNPSSKATLLTAKAESTMITAYNQMDTDIMTNANPNPTTTTATTNIATDMDTTMARTSSSDGDKSATENTISEDSSKKRRVDPVGLPHPKKGVRSSKFATESSKVIKRRRADSADDTEPKKHARTGWAADQWVTQKQVFFKQKAVKGKEVSDLLEETSCGGKFRQLRGLKPTLSHNPVKVFQCSCFEHAVTSIAKARGLDDADEEVRKEIENGLEYIPRVRVALPLLDDGNKQTVEPGLLWDLRFHKDNNFCSRVNEDGSKASRIALKD
jgi:hypothetical protein